MCECVRVVAHDRWQSSSFTALDEPDLVKAEKCRDVFFLLSFPCSPLPRLLAASLRTVLHFVTGGMVLTSGMPHGLFFFVSVFFFSLTVWHVRTVAV